MLNKQFPSVPEIEPGGDIQTIWPQLEIDLFYVLHPDVYEEELQLTTEASITPGIEPNNAIEGKLLKAVNAASSAHCGKPFSRCSAEEQEIILDLCEWSYQSRGVNPFVETVELNPFSLEETRLYLKDKYRKPHAERVQKGLVALLLAQTVSQ